MAGQDANTYVFCRGINDLRTYLAMCHPDTVYLVTADHTGYFVQVRNEDLPVRSLIIGSGIPVDLLLQLST